MPEETILVVDDEIANLQKLRRTFVNRYSVLSANSGSEALDLVRDNDGIAVIIADQRMPDMTGVDFLLQTLDLLPHAVRIILTGFTDVEVLMEAINSCKVYRYIVKPWLKFRLEPGDTLILASDGAMDALNMGGEFYDVDRFTESIRRHFAREISDCLKNLYSELRLFIGGAELSDDVTIIALRRRK